MTAGNGHVDCSAEELTALAMLAGRPRFPGVGGEAFAGLGDLERDAVLRSARRALAAHGVVSVDEAGTVTVAAPYEALIRVALSPGVFISAQRQTKQGGEVRLFLARPELGIELWSPSPGIDRLESLEPSELLDRVSAFVGLEHRPRSAGQAISTTVGALSQMRAGNGGTGALGPIAASFAGSATVRCLHGRGRVLGGELAWIDASDQGLWRVNFRVPAKGAAPEETEAILTSTDAGSILEELLSFLPAA